MALTLSDACTKIALIAGALAGVRNATARPPEQLNQFPSVTVLPGTGQFNPRPNGGSTGLHTIYCDLHAARKDQTRDLEKFIGYPELLSDAIWADPTLGGTVTVVTGVAYQLTSYDWGGMQTVGWRFTISAKCMRDT